MGKPSENHGKTIGKPQGNQRKWDFPWDLQLNCAKLTVDSVHLLHWGASPCCEILDTRLTHETCLFYTHPFGTLTLFHGYFECLDASIYSLYLYSVIFLYHIIYMLSMRVAACTCTCMDQSAKKTAVFSNGIGMQMYSWLVASTL